MRLDADRSRFAVLVKVLKTLALVDRVDDERRQPVDRRENPETLIKVVRLAVSRVSARDKHRRVRALEAFFERQKERAGNVNARLALENHVFDAEFFLRQTPGNLRVERRSLPKRAERVQEIVALFLLISLDVGGSFDFLIFGDPSVPRRVDLREKLRSHHRFRIFEQTFFDENRRFFRRFLRLRVLRFDLRNRANAQRRDAERRPKQAKTQLIHSQQHKTFLCRPIRRR